MQRTQDALLLSFEEEMTVEAVENIDFEILNVVVAIKIDL